MLGRNLTFAWPFGLGRRRRLLAWPSSDLGCFSELSRPKITRLALRKLTIAGPAFRLKVPIVSPGVPALEPDDRRSLRPPRAIAADV